MIRATAGAQVRSMKRQRQHGRHRRSLFVPQKSHKRAVWCDVRCDVRNYLAFHGVYQSGIKCRGCSAYTIENKRAFRPRIGVPDPRTGLPIASMTANSGLALSGWISVEFKRLYWSTRLRSATDWSTQDPRIGKPKQQPYRPKFSSTFPTIR